MNKTFFARYYFVVFIALAVLGPFITRGARLAIQSNNNNVKDWLPSDFPETQELEWFGQHFLGERFILITWPGCTTDDPSFQLLVEKLRAEAAVSTSNPLVARDAPSDQAVGPFWPKTDHATTHRRSGFQPRSVADATSTP